MRMFVVPLQRTAPKALRFLRLYEMCATRLDHMCLTSQGTYVWLKRGWHEALEYQRTITITSHILVR